MRKLGNADRIAQLRGPDRPGSPALDECRTVATRLGRRWSGWPSRTAFNRRPRNARTPRERRKASWPGRDGRVAPRSGATRARAARPDVVGQLHRCRIPCRKVAPTISGASLVWSMSFMPISRRDACRLWLTICEPTLPGGRWLRSQDLGPTFQHLVGHRLALTTWPARSLWVSRRSAAGLAPCGPVASPYSNPATRVLY